MGYFYHGGSPWAIWTPAQSSREFSHSIARYNVEDDHSDWEHSKEDDTDHQ